MSLQLNGFHKAAEVRRKRLNTVEGLADAYFIDAELGTHRFNAKPKRPGTIAEEKRIYNKLVKPKFGKSAVADITRARDPSPLSASKPRAPYPMVGIAGISFAS